MSWDELRGDEKGWSCSDEMKTVEKNLLWWHVRRDGMRWEELRRAHVIWGEMKCRVRSARVKCEVQGVKGALWSVRKVFAWRCIAPGSCAGHVLGQHLCNSLAQSTHARARLAHGACKFFRWKMSYSIYIYIPKATFAPPRAGTTGIHTHIYIYNIYIGNTSGKTLSCNLLRNGPLGRTWRILWIAKKSYSR